MTEENSYYMDYYLVITWLLPGYYQVPVYYYIYKIRVYTLIWYVRLYKIRVYALIWNPSPYRTNIKFGKK